MQPTLTIHPVPDFPIVHPGDDVALVIIDALAAAGLSLVNGDVVVVAQKIVSLSEGRLMRLEDVEVSPAADELAMETDKDPRLVELILRESSKVVRKKPGVIITKHRLGMVAANAGVDQSNIDHSNGKCALLLPENPDRSAEHLRWAISRATGRGVGVVVCDSMNRAWRLGTIGTAIGSAGITVLDDCRGKRDLHGRELKVTVSNRADAIAAAAVLVMGEGAEQTPVVIVRGFSTERTDQVARDCIRPAADDMFL
jgi:coenzyme F420-0:L-glutamate ligase/coenzyme F420-1:gamma-L-glutamate ligase